MKQATHAWIAIRAAALIGDDPEMAGLFAILRPHIRNAALGAWMPDLADTKLGSGDIDNHVFKMGPVRGCKVSGVKCKAEGDGRRAAVTSYPLSATRFITPKAELLAALGPARAVAAFLAEDKSLNAGWWSTPYKADPLPCQDIPTRANALSTTLTDQMILGERGVTRRMPRTFALSTQVTPDERTRAEQLALFFFMQSHFIADACMPCHCDARPVAAYAGKLHPQWEGMIEKRVGKEFEGRKLAAGSVQPGSLLKAAKEVDGAFGISFPTSIPEPRTSDPWKDTVAICRASFAVSSIIASPRQFPYSSENGSLPLADIKTDTAEWASFVRATAAIVHDAVLNVAMGWKRVWLRFGAKKGAGR